ncbi:phosducin [Rhizoctonia solani]|uniref:Phosducin n=1 Tax=Rhizoctonia solani TaxID=456999 RepID=A0A8H7I8M9_9AGAM|nr:phosducin [Rhizoctonia solani]
MDAGLEELVLSGALFNKGGDGEKSPQRSRSVSPTPNTDDELFGSDFSRPESPIDALKLIIRLVNIFYCPPQTFSHLTRVKPLRYFMAGMGPGRTGVKALFGTVPRRGSRKFETAQEIAELNAKLEKTALTARTFKETKLRRNWKKKSRCERAVSKAQGVSRCAAVDESLARIARSHVSTKFLRARASAIGFAVLNSGSGLFDPRVAPVCAIDSDEEHGSDVLVYRGGQLEHTFIRVDWEAGQGGIQNLLIKHGILPSMSFSTNPVDSLGLQESDEEYDLDD